MSRDEVSQTEVNAVHSATLAEDGKTIVILYDLKDGGSGCQSFVVGELQSRHPIHRVQ